MKANRILIAAIWFLAAAVANFGLAFMGNGNNFGIRMLCGILFLVCLFLAWREWNKQRETVKEES